MKKLISLSLIIILAFSLSGCYHESYEYTDIKDYSKIEKLPEIRENQSLEIIPEDIEKRNVEKFYFSWNLGFVGSASVQLQCSVKYNNSDFKAETNRIKSIKGDGAKGKKITYKKTGFKYPAYVSVFGYDDTNCYALIDSENKTIHYIYLSLMYKDNMKIDKKLLPDNYKELGEIKGESFSIYEYK